MRMLACAIALCVSLANVGIAASPVDEAAAVDTISTDFGLADGPAWDGAGALYVPDVKGGKLLRYTSRTNKMQIVLPEAGRISASFFNHGKLFLSDNGESRILRLDGKDKVVITVHDPEAKPAIRPNDLVIDKNGDVYYTLTGQSQVMYVSPGGERQIAIADIETPNGLTLSPDESVLYVAAYVPKQIWAYDVNAGLGKNARIFAEMDSAPEKGADGMTIDRAGNVYCAGPKHVWIWSPDGKLLDKIETPTRPINCAFGDQDMRSLYITGFGGLYRQRMTISGRPPHPSARAENQAANPNRPTTTIPPGVVAHLDVVYAKSGNRKLLADIFVPETQPKPTPAIVVVHGGGWLNGDKTKFRALAVELASRGYVTAAIEYRLGGEAKFPAGIQDCNASVRFLRANAERYKLDPNRIGAVGGSAGGHLVGLMAAAPHISELQGDGGNSAHSSKLQAAIVMAGPLEILTGSVAERSRTQAEQSNSNKWLGKTVDEAPELYKLADAHVHFSKESPSILFMVGEHDKPERNQPTRDKLKGLGVWTDVSIYKDGKHGCWNQLPWFNGMVADMDKFFQEQL
ncbi:MAG: hypothetical protein CMJ64_30295 [Planctomycetaceae bacterium]|nr:hypothetical protein [Planctomycetaceae bacterium]